MPDPEVSRVPYPGLRPFEADEADLFFGREKHVDALLKRLSHGHFVAVVGESGAGKSSLVRAGLLPALQAGFVVEAGADWRVAVFRPGGAPLVALGQALVQPGVLTEEGGKPRLEFALAELRRGPLGLVQLVTDAHLERYCNLLIVVDQFEELFRYCREPAQKDEADIFVELLIRAADQKQVPIFVVLTMRSDFVGDCARFRGLPEMLNDNQYLTPRLTRDQIAAAITEPARVCGGTVEPALVNELCNAVGDNPDQLPLLQHLLLRVWDRARQVSTPPRLTTELSREMGGLHSTLNDQAQHIYASLDDVQKGAARTMFRRLTDPLAQRRDVRRDAIVGDIAEVAAVPVDTIVAVADRFRARGCHMLMPPPAVPLDAHQRLDISHESLIRQWTTLKEWAREESVNAREFLRLRDAALAEREGPGDLLTGRDLTRALDWKNQAKPTPIWAARYGAPGDVEATLEFIDRSAAEAQRRKQEEQRLVEREAAAERTRMRSRIAVGVALLATAVLAVMVYLWVQAERGRSEAAVARGAAHARQLAANAHIALPTDPALALVLAQAAVREVDHDDQALDALRAALAEYVPNIESTFEIAKSRSYIAGTGESAFLDFSLNNASLSPRDNLVIVPSGNLALIVSTTFSVPARELRGHTSTVGSARFNPDGTLAVTTSADHSARVWDVTTALPVSPPLKHDDLINNAVFNRDGSILVTLGDDGLAKMWNVGNYSAPRCVLTTDDYAVAASFSHDQRHLVTVTHQGGAKVWNVGDACPNEPVKIFEEAKWAAFSPQDALLGIVDFNWGAQIVRTSDWTSRASLSSTSAADEAYSTWSGSTLPSPPPLAWSSDGRFVAVAQKDYTLRILGVVDERDSSISLRGHTGRITSVTFHPRENTLLTTSADRTARVWRLMNGKPSETRVLRGPKETVGSGAFATDSDRIVTVGEDARLRVWTPRWALTHRTINAVMSAKFAPNEEVWATRFDAHTGAPSLMALLASTLMPAREELRLSEQAAMFFGARMVGLASDGQVKLYNLPDMTAGVPLAGGAGVFAYPDLHSPDARFVIGYDAALKVWDLASPNTPSTPIASVGEACEPLAIANDKRVVSSCPSKNQLIVSEIDGQKPLSIAEPDKRTAHLAQFSGTGRWLAAAFDDYSVRVFDSTTGGRVATMRGHDAPIARLAFSADDRRMVTVAHNGSARIWDPSGAQVASLDSALHANLAGTPLFSPDGLSVLFRLFDHVVVWRCDVCGDRESLLRQAESVDVNRPLSPEEARRFGLDGAAGSADAAAHAHQR